MARRWKPSLDWMPFVGHRSPAPAREASVVSIIGSARRFWLSQRFQDELLESQYREAKFKAGRPRIAALGALVTLIEMHVLISSIVLNDVGMRTYWFFVIAPSACLWTMLVLLYSPWMSSSRLPRLAYCTAAMYEILALGGLLAGVLSSKGLASTEPLSHNESHNARQHARQHADLPPQPARAPAPPTT